MTLPPTKSNPAREAHVRVAIADRDGATQYDVNTLTHLTGGVPTWRFTKLNANGDADDVYDVTVDGFGALNCTCWGNTRHGRCKHADLARTLGLDYAPAAAARPPHAVTTEGQCARCGGVGFVIEAGEIADCPSCERKGGAR